MKRIVFKNTALADRHFAVLVVNFKRRQRDDPVQ